MKTYHLAAVIFELQKDYWIFWIRKIIESVIFWDIFYFTFLCVLFSTIMLPWTENVTFPNLDLQIVFQSI